MHATSPHTLGRLLAVITLAVAVSCASVRAAETMEISEPARVRVTMASDVPMYDLMWSRHRARAMDAFASDIIREIESPSGYYVIEIPQLPMEWEAQSVRGSSELTDMNGQTIRRRLLTKRVRNYERDHHALITELAERIRDAKPGVRFAFSTVEPMGAGRRGALDYSLSVDQFHLDQPLDWNGRESSLDQALLGPLSKKSIGVLRASGAEFSFQVRRGGWHMGSLVALESTSSQESPAVSPEDSPVVRNGYVEFPTRREKPFGSQHGRVRLEDVEVHEAKYERMDNVFVGIPLSHKNIARRGQSNPRGWLTRYNDLPTAGFESRNLNYDMQALHALGIREVWFWGWSGQHKQDGELAESVMPWYTPESHTQIMKQTWPTFVRRWQARGMRFGFWAGGVAFPNMGTADNPDHQAIQREHFAKIADDLAELKEIGFDAVGLDAFVWILSRRDQPEWANWRANQYGPRDPGIALALQQHLNDDPRLDDLHIVTEARVPYGELLAEMPTFKLTTSRSDNRSDSRPDVNTLEAPHYEDIVNPGHEIIKYLMTSGRDSSWTYAEFASLIRKIRDQGYRPAMHIGVLKELDFIDNRGNARRDISALLSP